MKKLIFALGVTLALASCSSDDSSSSSSSDVLLKKTIETFDDGSSITSTYTYSGNKLQKVTESDGYVTRFTYTGDLITKLEYLEDGELVQTATFTYNGNGQLTAYLSIDTDFDEGRRETYVYNNDGTVTITNYIGNASSQTELNGTGTVTLSNGEVTSIVTNYSVDYTYTYDTHKNPGINITGLNKLAFFDSEATGMVNHNLLTEVSNGGLSTDVYTYTYNADDYPTTSVETEEGETTTTQYFYNN